MIGGKETLHASRHWLVEADAEQRVVWLRRLPTPFASLAEIVNANDAVVQTLRARHREYGVIVDMRQAPARNDPAFEKAMQGLRAHVESCFARSAVLLATPVGMLQVNRIAREEGAKSFATTSEAAALRFARGDGDAARG